MTTAILVGTRDLALTNENAQEEQRPQVHGCMAWDEVNGWARGAPGFP